MSFGMLSSAYAMAKLSTGHGMLKFAQTIYDIIKPPLKSAVIQIDGLTPATASEVGLVGFLLGGALYVLSKRNMPQ